MILKSTSSRKSLISILRDSCEIQINDARVDDHYFCVKLENLIGEGKKFLNFEHIRNFLSQISPVDFDFEDFSFASEIKEASTQTIMFIPSVSILISQFGQTDRQIFKPYKK